MDAAPPPRQRPRLPPPRRRRPSLPPPPPDLHTLSPELLDTILSRLPLRDAVRTSVLSRAWRHRWESVPSLDFSWHNPLPQDPGAITAVLSRYSCPVAKFDHRHIKDEQACCHSDDWLHILASKGVRSLTLCFDLGMVLFQSIHTLHPSIFSCRDLTALHLEFCIVPATPPGFTGLPKLTSLHLTSVDFVGQAARELALWIATSPSLEYLNLDNLWLTKSEGVSEPWVVQAPKLRMLRINEHVDRWWQIDELPSLEVAIIEYLGARSFINLVTALASACQLELDIPTATGNALEGLSPTFHNLKDLSLRIILCLQSNVLSLLSLLRNAPKLESLNIELLFEGPFLDDEVGSDFLNAQWTDDMFSNLRCIEIRGLICNSSEMNFIEFVLSKARRLEKLNAYIAPDCPRTNQDVLLELVKFRRASPGAEVFFKRTD